MRIICFCFLFLVSITTTFSQNRYRGLGRGGPSLVARKNGQKQHYWLGATVRIVTNGTGSNKVVKGNITHFEKNNITIETFRRDSISARVIYTSEIQKIRFLSRRGRKDALILLGAGGVYAGIMALITKPGPWQYVVFLPAMADALFFVYYFPLTYLFDFILQKRRSNGWEFNVEFSPLHPG